MALSRLMVGLLITLSCKAVFAAAPTVDAPLPALNIAERGELTVDGDDFKFVPWSSDTDVGKVQVIQYFGATLGDRDTFAPFTDLLQTSFAPGTVHVTTVLNLDAALWGTTGMVVSELKKNKRAHPDATMVLDDEGSGVSAWDLGKDGTGLMIVNKQGIVKFFSRQALGEEELKTTIELIRANLD